MPAESLHESPHVVTKKYTLGDFRVTLVSLATFVFLEFFKFHYWPLERETPAQYQQ
jgi:hypothetical protein